MANSLKTYIFCYDDHRGFSEEVKKKFADLSRYKVESFQTREEFIARIEQDKENKGCRIAILGLHDTPEQFEFIDHLTRDIKKINHSIGLILLGPQDRIEDIRKNVKFNIDAYIPKNANSILRIHNMVKKLISENGILIFRKRSLISVYMLIGFLFLAVVSLLVAYFRFPQYF
jgi:hypothetical protein